MELSSPESIRALLLAYDKPAPAQRRRNAPSVSARYATKDRRTRCRCGHCRQCRDNARWERIFAEKFADPDYYNKLVTHRTSPLASL